MVSVIIDRNTKKIVSIVEGQKLKSDENNLVHHSKFLTETEIINELNELGILSESVAFDIVFQRDALGDILLLLPVINGIKRAHPHLTIALKTNDWIIPLLEGLPFLDFVSDLHSAVYGKEVNLTKIGDFIAEKDGRENQHRTLYYEDKTKELLPDYDFDLDYDFELIFHESEIIKKKILELNGNKVILAPKSKSYFRMWGQRDNKGKDHNTELELIRQCPDWNFIVLHDVALPEYDRFNNVLNLSGEIDILECVTACRFSDFGIVPDSGMMHVLGFLNIPTIAIFGNVIEPEYRISTYKKVFPISTPTQEYNDELYEKEPYCHISVCWDGQVHNCIGKEHEKWCTKEITVERVLQEYDNKIKNTITSTPFIANPYNFKKYAVQEKSKILRHNKLKSVSKYFDDDIKGVRYVGQYGTSGYAIAAKGYMFDMHMSGIPLEWIPIRHIEHEIEDNCMYSAVVRTRMDKKVNPDVMLIHDPPDNWERWYKDYRSPGIGKVIGFVAWETERLPKKWVKFMNAEYIDEVWCPTTYNQRVYRESGVLKNVRVVPHVWMGKILPKVKKSSNYVFYNISEYTERKGVEDLLNSLCQEFTIDDKVELVFKTHYKFHSSMKSRQFVTKEYRRIMKQYEKPPKIRLILEHFTEEEIMELHSYGDCYYTPCRAEGFGLPIYDALNYGNDIIATGYSGHMDFLGEKHKGLIDYKMGKVTNMAEFSEIYVGDDQYWAIPDMTHAKKLIREHYEDWLNGTIG